MNVSVCMATCNGERFLREQLDSLLPQLNETDELIIIDDVSCDGTREILAAYTDSRIHCYSNSMRLGHVQSFARAIIQARNAIIVLADQDDIWVNGRLQHMKEQLEPEAIQVVAGNFNVINEDGIRQAPPQKKLYVKDSKKHWRNALHIFLGTRPYYGCAMAFKRELNTLILPIPAHVESHDLWIAFAGNINKSTIHTENIILHKREHTKNTSSKMKRSFIKIFVSRAFMCLSVIILLSRKHFSHKTPV